jgi:hypothetical protein
MVDKRVAFQLTASDRTAAVFRSVRGNLEGMARSAAVLNTTLGTVAGAFGGALAAGTLTAFFGSIVRGIDRLNDLRDATGATVPNLSALEDVAARTGTSFDGMASTLVKFNKSLQEADPGSRTERVLRQIGLSARELRDLDPAEALRRTAVALAGYSVDGDKARIVQELFGKSISEAGPFLAELAAQTKLTGKVTSEQAAAAEQFNKELLTLQKNATDAARALVMELVPALNRLFEAKRTGGLSAAGGALLGLTEADREANAIRHAKNALDAAQRALEAGPSLFTRTIGSKEDNERELLRLESEAMRAQERLDHLLRRQGDRAAQAESDNELARRFSGGRAKAGRVTDPVRDARLTAEQIAKLQAEAEEQAAKDTAEAWKFWEGQQLADYKALIDARDAATRAQIEADEQAARDTTEAWLFWEDQQLANHKKMAESWERQIAPVQDAIGDTLLAGIEGRFEDIDDLWRNLLQRMIVRALEARLSEALFGVTGTGGLLGGFLGGIFGGGKAVGGSVDGRHAYLVGERGPEIFVPRATGEIIPNGRAKSMRTGTTVAPTYQIHIDSRTDQAEVQRLVLAGITQGNKQLVDQMHAMGRL